MSENPLNEKTIEDLLTYDTEELMKFSPQHVSELLDRAIHEQEEILKKVPKKKDPVLTDLRSQGLAKTKKAAATIRNNIAALPPEFAALMADVQNTLAEARKLQEGGK